MEAFAARKDWFFGKSSKPMNRNIPRQQKIVTVRKWNDFKNAFNAFITGIRLSNRSFNPNENKNRKKYRHVLY